MYIWFWPTLPIIHSQYHTHYPSPTHEHTHNHLGCADEVRDVVIQAVMDERSHPCLWLPQQTSMQ